MSMFRGISQRRHPIALRRPVAVGGGNALSFTLGGFTNASDRYPRYGASISGPFGANVLATRYIGGHRYGLIEKAFSTENSHTEVFRAAISNWANVNADVTDDAISSPIGNITADLIYDNSSPASSHTIHQTMTPDGSSAYVFGCFASAHAYSRMQFTVGPQGFPGNPRCSFNLSTGAVYDAAGVDFSIMIPVGGGFYYCAIGVTSDAAVASIWRIYLVNNAGDTTYDGDGSSGIYLWGADVIKANYLSSYIKADAAAATKNKDVLIYPVASLPSWIKGQQNIPFSFNLIPNYSSVQLTADGGKKYLFSVDGTEDIECYLNGADNKLYIDVDAGNVFVSAAAFTWSAQQICKVTIIPDNGANCNVITSGFTTGNADETDTSFSMQSDGDLSHGSRHTTDDLQFDGFLSEFRLGRA